MTATGKPRVEREARLEWVPIGLMTVSAMAQRDLNQSRVDALAANFDIEQMGTPTVNHRDGVVYIVDGQHRIAALEAIGYGDQRVQCWAYDGLTEEQEAEKFLQLNDQLIVNAFSKFKVGVKAGREEPVAINRVVRSCGLRVSLDKQDGSIGAVTTLAKVYRRGGAGVLARTLCIIRDAYGDAGLEAALIEGVGLVCHRYGPDLSDERAVKALSKIMGGVPGLLNKAEILRKQTGSPKGHCVAAAVVDQVNRSRGGRWLPSWWGNESNGALSPRPREAGEPAAS